MRGSAGFVSAIRDRLCSRPSLDFRVCSSLTPWNTPAKARGVRLRAAHRAFLDFRVDRFEHLLDRRRIEQFAQRHADRCRAWPISAADRESNHRRVRRHCRVRRVHRPAPAAPCVRLGRRWKTGWRLHPTHHDWRAHRRMPPPWRPGSEAHAARKPNAHDFAKASSRLSMLLSPQPPTLLRDSVRLPAAPRDDKSPSQSVRDDHLTLPCLHRQAIDDRTGAHCWQGARGNRIAACRPVAFRRAGNRTDSSDSTRIARDSKSHGRFASVSNRH